MTYQRLARVIMSNFTTEELQQLIKLAMKDNDLNTSELEINLLSKIKSMIDNDQTIDNFDLIGSGSLLFQNKCSSSALLANIERQLELCVSNDESKCFRIDWKIIYGQIMGI